ncbi:hypothetical protein D3C74_170150 [compost metagenome]
MENEKSKVLKDKYQYKSPKSYILPFARRLDVSLNDKCPQCKEDQKKRKTIDKLEALKVLAQQREGRYLSRIYYNVDTKLRWECREGHQWESTHYSVKNGSWCPICAYKDSGMYKRNNIKDIQRLAERNDWKMYI